MPAHAMLQPRLARPRRQPLSDESARQQRASTVHTDWVSPSGMAACCNSAMQQHASTEIDSIGKEWRFAPNRRTIDDDSAGSAEPSFVIIMKPPEASTTVDVALQSCSS
ncbi:hypothetical protein MANES_14G158366v8 [Manihot esculenta]|uniref:Uncharacterized protein n=1 Tax=Manihot esculenta TaxID=3983 RepID=A0ACB7GH29_MANES|nr:hypothetical protein MANES_14G158366v8 [Manihot esculenta]